MKGDIKDWIQAIRAFSFTASVVPVLLGAAWAFIRPHDVVWGLLPVFLLCSVLIHAGTNLINDYYDYENDVDKGYAFGSSGVLVSRKLEPQQLKKGAWIVFVLAFVLGLIIVFMRGWPIFILGVLGIIAGFFYTASPFAYKYVALGDLFVFLFMGIFLVMGSFYALTGVWELHSFFVGIPVSLLVIAILHGNNVRDLKHDQESGIKTMAIILGHRTSRYYYYGLVIGAFLFIGYMIASGVLSGWSLLVCLCLPMALRNMKMMKTSDPDKPEGIAMIDVASAQCHLAFGLLYIASIIISGVVS
ncbi:MAG: 1,4-dihydroxy-2-naphthoate octaprenyltransferase [Candidatus Omnitrophica bacterium]|nr:1,4-dihydroxy-2-naphthoate octaprenyltransferase [Candidatus Omnitrophota bacterium]